MLATEPSDEWLTTDRPILHLVQDSVSIWAGDLGRSMQRAAAAVEKARAHADQPNEEVGNQLEDALGQIGSARDKLIAVAALVFGVPSLVVQKPGIKFEPKESAVKNKLSDLGAAGHASAGVVKSRLDALADHPAITLRNQIIHALSPLGQIVANCWFRLAELDDKGGIRAGGWSAHILYPKGSLDQGDIKPETIWNWVVASADEALVLLDEATDALATLVVEVGTVALPQAVYRWPDGRVQFDRPKSDWLQKGVTTGGA